MGIGFMEMNIIEYPFISIYQLFRWFKHGWILIVQFFLMFTNSWRVWPIASHDGEVLANPEDFFRGWPYAESPFLLDDLDATLKMRYTSSYPLGGTEMAIPIFFSPFVSPFFVGITTSQGNKKRASLKAPRKTVAGRWIGRQQKHHEVAKLSPLGVWSTPPEVRRSAVDRYYS